MIIEEVVQQQVHYIYLQRIRIFQRKIIMVVARRDFSFVKHFQNLITFALFFLLLHYVIRTVFFLPVAQL